MNKMKIKICAFALIMAVSVGGFTGCSSSNDVVALDTADTLYATRVKEAPVSAEPKEAIKQIYADAGYAADELTIEFLTKKTGIQADDVIEVFGKYSDPKSTLADIIILKPIPGSRDEVRKQLHLYREERMREFENYDILDAYSIAKGAVIYDQGEYLIMLMLADNEEGQTIVDQYIPQ